MNVSVFKTLIMMSMPLDPDAGRTLVRKPSGVGFN